MNTPIDEHLLEEKLAEIEKARSWSPRVIAKLENFIRTSNDYDLLRVNPLRFAEKHTISEKEAIDLFLFAAKLDLFRMEWILFCSSCGCIVESLKSLTTVHAHYRCEICAGETAANLDDYIAVYFEISPNIRPIAFHDPHSLSAEDYYFKYKYPDEAFFAGGVIPEVPKDMRTSEYFKSKTKVLALLQPNETKTFEIEMIPDFFAVDESANRTQTFFLVSGETAPAEQNFEISLGDPVPPPIQLGSGKLYLHVINKTNKPAHLFAPNLPASLFELRKAGVRIRNILLGNRLLINATFKELFRHEVVASDEGIGIRDITLLFTDLKGSTDLYDRIGDLKAFALVREHFEHLSRAITKCSGVVVKTVGDQVMAAFINPLDGIRSACAISQGIAEFNTRLGGKDIILKMGLHRGPAIAVTLNDRIDYFGQTVNIAARVQAFADAEEICFTDSLHNYPGVHDLLSGVEIQTESAKLKGVAEKITVYKITGRGVSQGNRTKN